MKIKNIILIIFSAFLMNALFGQTAFSQVVLETSIDKADFDTALSTNMVWYAQFQPGGPGLTYPDNEFEFGTTQNTYFGNTAQLNVRSPNPFSVNIDNLNYLSVTFNGTVTPDTYEIAVTEKYNKIFVGLIGDNLVPSDTVDVTGQQANGYDLSDLQITGSPSFVGYSFLFEENGGIIDNIGQLEMTGLITPDTFGASDNNWSFVVVGTYDSMAVPEPASVGIILGFLTLLYVYFRRKS